MKFIITDHQEILGDWALQKIPYATTWNSYRAIGLVTEKEILATVIYNDFYEAGCAIHIAAVPGRQWLTRAFLYAAFDYPFNQLKFRRLTGYVASRNTQAQRLDEHLGFKREGYLRHMLPDDDVIIYGMIKSECRFLELSSNGRKKYASSSARPVSDSGSTNNGESEYSSIQRRTDSHEHLHANGKSNIH